MSGKEDSDDVMILGGVDDSDNGVFSSDIEVLDLTSPSFISQQTKLLEQTNASNLNTQKDAIYAKRLAISLQMQTSDVSSHDCGGLIVQVDSDSDCEIIDLISAQEEMISRRHQQEKEDARIARLINDGCKETDDEVQFISYNKHDDINTTLKRTKPVTTADVIILGINPSPKVNTSQKSVGSTLATKLNSNIFQDKPVLPTFNRRFGPALIPNYHLERANANLNHSSSFLQTKVEPKNVPNAPRKNLKDELFIKQKTLKMTKQTTIPMNHPKKVKVTRLFPNLSDMSDEEEEQRPIFHNPYRGPYTKRPGVLNQIPNAILRPADDPEDYAMDHLNPQQVKEHLEKLLENVNSYGENLEPHERLKTPHQMVIKLLAHQQLGVDWMHKMELGTNRGGILADDMGLGKTIQSIALMCLNMPPISDKRPTLIVAPLSLLDQWAAEIKEKTKKGTFKIYKHHGGTRLQDFKQLSTYDVVLTTFGVLSTECPTDDSRIKDTILKKKKKKLKHQQNGIDDETDDSSSGKDNRRLKTITTLFKVKWHRVILDEAHIIKNRATKASLACQFLKSTYRWCLTGTPIQNSIQDLFGLIRFLDIKPYCNWGHFQNHITRPFSKGKRNAVITKVKLVLEALCLRRTKDYKLDGKPIIVLPSKTVVEEQNTFTVPEDDFYQALFKKARVQFNIYLKQGTVMKNYSHVLAWLLRLRQACCHPSLVTTAGTEDPFEEAARDKRNDYIRGKTWQEELDALQPVIIERMLEARIHMSDCSICWDVLSGGMIVPRCGHAYCNECIRTHLGRKEPNEQLCPQCRGLVNLSTLIPVSAFMKKHGKEVKEEVPVFMPEVCDTVLDVTMEDVMAKRKSAKFESTEWMKELSPSFVRRIRKTDRLEHQDNLVKKYRKDWITSSKISRMIDIVRAIRDKDMGDKIIIFSQFTSFLDLLELPLIENGFKFARYDGTMLEKERTDAITLLKSDPDCNVMLVSLKCGSLGLNLVCANHVILLDVWWNPAVEQQAIDRTHRIGQVKEVFVHRITIAGTVEDRILELQKEKQEVMDAALGDGQMSRGAGLSLGDLMRLFEVAD